MNETTKIEFTMSRRQVESLVECFGRFLAAPSLHQLFEVVFEQEVGFYTWSLKSCWGHIGIDADVNPHQVRHAVDDMLVDGETETKERRYSNLRPKDHPMREVKQYERRTIGMAILPKGEPLYSEQATRVSIEDEVAGEYVKVSQELGVSEGPGSITICPEEWEVLRGVINFMVSECRVDTDTPSEGETNENRR